MESLLDYRAYDSRFLAPKDAHGIKVAFFQPLIPDGNYLPNLGIMYLSALLIKAGYDVRVFDENIHKNPIKDVVDFCPSLIGFTCVTPAIDSVNEHITKIKKELPDVMTMVGGPHISLTKQEALENNDLIDFGIIGEAEKNIAFLCNTILKDGIRENETLGKIAGLVYRGDGKEVLCNPPAPFMSSEELDDLPFPAWHLLPIEEIFKKATHGLFSRGKRIMPLMTTRGCPNSCGYCCSIMGRKLRHQSVSRALTEAKWLYDTFKIDEIYFEDDTFTQQREHALNILDGLIGLNLPVRIKFANGLRADKVDKPLLEKMLKAGAYWVGFGIDSGSKNTLKLMRKNLDLDLAAKNIKLAKSLGLKVGSNLIIGYPGETKQSIKESIRYFLKLDLDSFAVVNCVPFPGTEAWRICKEKGWFTDHAKTYGNYWFKVFKVVPLIETPYLSARDLSKAVFWIYIRFYLLNFKRFWAVSKAILKKILNAVRDSIHVRDPAFR